MSKSRMLGLLVVGVSLLINSVVRAQSITALYRVAKVQHVYKLNDPKCVDNKDTKCPKTLHWRVHYQALSQQVSLQHHQILLDDQPPQVGSVAQLTIDLK